MTKTPAPALDLSSLAHKAGAFPLVYASPTLAQAVTPAATDLTAAFAAMLAVSEQYEAECLAAGVPSFMVSGDTWRASFPPSRVAPLIERLFELKAAATANATAESAFDYAVETALDCPEVHTELAAAFVAMSETLVDLVTQVERQRLAVESLETALMVSEPLRHAMRTVAVGLTFRGDPAPDADIASRAAALAAAITRSAASPTTVTESYNDTPSVGDAT